MSYREYVIAAYVVFAVVLIWDFIAPRMRMANARHATRQQAVRRANAKPSPTGELQR